MYMLIKTSNKQLITYNNYSSKKRGIGAVMFLFFMISTFTYSSELYILNSENQIHLENITHDVELQISKKDMGLFKTNHETLSFDSSSCNDSLSTQKEKLIKKLNRRKKIIACVLAFPFPFGILGLHRIYLGSKPYVPLTYITALGGEFGIIPFIDFVVLIKNKNIDHFINNSQIIMWGDY